MGLKTLPCRPEVGRRVRDRIVPAVEVPDRSNRCDSSLL